MRVPGVVVEFGHTGAPAGGVGLIRDGGHPLGHLVGVRKELRGKGCGIVRRRIGWLGEGPNIGDKGGFTGIVKPSDSFKRRVKSDGFRDAA